MIHYLQSKPDDIYFYPKNKKAKPHEKKKKILIYLMESSLESEPGLEAGGFVWVWEPSYALEI